MFKRDCSIQYEINFLYKKNSFRILYYEESYLEILQLGFQTNEI